MDYWDRKDLSTAALSLFWSVTVAALQLHASIDPATVTAQNYEHLHLKTPRHYSSLENRLGYNNHVRMAVAF